MKEVRILYAEDEMTKYTAIARAMKSMGFRITTLKSNVEDALDEVISARDSGAPYDIIMTDMNYPIKKGVPSSNASGPEFIRRLKENGIDTPIIEISSVNYNVEGAFSCIWYVESHMWERDLEKALKDAISIVQK